MRTVMMLVLLGPPMFCITYPEHCDEGADVRPNGGTLPPSKSVSYFDVARFGFQN